MHSKNVKILDIYTYKQMDRKFTSFAILFAC